MEYCLRCDIAYHIEMTCEEVEEEKKTLAELAKMNQINNAVLPEDRALEEWAKRSGAKRCI